MSTTYNITYNMKVIVLHAYQGYEGCTVLEVELYDEFYDIHAVHRLYTCAYNLLVTIYM